MTLDSREVLDWDDDAKSSPRTEPLLPSDVFRGVQRFIKDTAPLVQEMAFTAIEYGTRVALRRIIHSEDRALSFPEAPQQFSAFDGAIDDDLWCTGGKTTNPEV